MPVHQISVVPIGEDSTVHRKDHIRSRRKRKENEAQSLSQGSILSGAAQLTTTTSCQEMYSRLIIPVSHAHITKQQVKRQYRRRWKTECVDQPHNHDSSSGEEQYHRAAQSWSRAKTRRRRRPCLLPHFRDDETHNQDLTTCRRMSLELKELDSESKNHRGISKDSEEREGEEEETEERTIMKTYEEQGSESADNSGATAQKHAEACSLNRTLQEACADNELEVCRICHGEGDEQCPLITPCHCIGSLRFVHHACLYQWIKSSDTRCCELCKYNFVMETQLKPLRKWESLQMSTNERRRIFCSVIFHLVAVACVTWSLYIFSVMNQPGEGVQPSKEHKGLLERLFWTKLGIVTLSAVSGLIFMSIQCKVYLNMWQRLKAFNRIIFVHNCPDSVCRRAEKTTPPNVSSIHQTPLTTCCSMEGRSGKVEPV